MMENGDPGAEAAMEAAQQAMEAANTAYVEALEEFIEEFIDILTTTFIQLNAEYASAVDSLEIPFNTSTSELDTYMNATYEPVMGGSPVGHADSLDVLGVDLVYETADLNTLVNDDPSVAEYVAKSKNYWESVSAYRTAVVVKELKDELTENSDIDAFVAMMKAEDLNLLREIGERIKEELPEQEIVDHVKGKIVTTVGKVVVKLANESPD